ncbi:MAG: acyl-CoA dehydrogenase family protein, partial [Anaerolineales bacterium]|nr:acyl-CoA dehydrogenase family protein [Anaerolineales bacterium]
MDFDLSAEQKAWQKIVHDFAEKELRPKAREVDEKEEFNWEAARKGGPVGLLGMSIPEEFGGSNVDMISNAIAFEELGWGCGST